MSVLSGNALVSSFDEKTFRVNEARSAADLGIVLSGNYTLVFYYSDIIVGDVNGILSYNDLANGVFTSYVDEFIFTLRYSFDGNVATYLLSYTGDKDNKQYSGIAQFIEEPNDENAPSKLIRKKLF